MPSHWVWKVLGSLPERCLDAVTADEPAWLISQQLARLRS
jgi:hypothetical protein